MLGLTDAEQTEIAADQPTATEPASPSPSGDPPLPTATDAPEAQTGVQPVSPIPIEPTPLEPAPLTGKVPQELLQAVIEDLLGRIDASREAVVVDQAGAVTWRDGSLGCPQPGMMYTQALVPGYQIVLRVGEETFDYHASDGGYFVLCAPGMAEEPLPPGEGSVPQVEPGLETLIAQAKSDLAAKLSVGVDQIQVLEARGVVWPDASLGCPLPDMLYKQVPTDGALIRLQAEGQVYEYHSGGGRDPFLCEQPAKSQEDTLPPIDLLSLTPGSRDE